MSKKVEKGRANQRQRLAALLISSGVTQRQTAEIVGVDENTVGRWKKQEAFKNLLAKRIAEVEGEVSKARDILIEGAVLAALKELDSLKSEDEAIALRAAGEILDRVGISKTAKIEQDVTISQFPTVVFELRKRAENQSPRGPGGDTGEPGALPGDDNGDRGRED